MATSSAGPAFRACACLAIATAALIPPPAAWSAPGPVVPERERRAVENLPLQAPRESAGVERVEPLGTLPLGREFPGMQGYVLRVRRITVAPGGQVGLHRHDRRPGVAVMLEGTMTERRAPDLTPRPLGPGEVALEDSGVVHWWRNETGAPTRAVVIDIVPAGTP
ncbi:MAG: cupin domain-containing protein [Synechococcaceae cyanobacterium]|nr:cupin domain-containing protein [Synechococcaceae cyanobacterium]